MNPENIEKLKKVVDDTTFSWIGLVVAIFLLAAFVQVMRSWYRDDAGLADPNDQILNQIEELHREGDVTDEEFRSIKSQITGRTKS